nr:hypothetical protein [Tanacetum cinerariifolium]
SDGTSGTPGLEPVPSSVPEPPTTVVVGVGVGGVVEEAESHFFFLALAFGFGAASPYRTVLLSCLVSQYHLDCREQYIIPNVMPVNFVLSRDGRLPRHEIINDDFRESGIKNVLSGGGSSDGDGIVNQPRSTTQVVTRGHLIIGYEVKEYQEKDKIRSKRDKKREAWQSREKFKAVTVDKGRKTEENKKRMVKNARTSKKLFKFKEKEETRSA